MAGLLTYPGFRQPSHPGVRNSGMVMAGNHDAFYASGLTAAGTVADFHGIPFSSRNIRDTISRQI